MNIDDLVGAVPARARTAIAARVHPQWADILKKAWSIRIMAVAFVLSGVEAVLPLYSGNNLMSAGAFAALTFFIVGSAFVARIYAQTNMGVSE